MAKRPVPLYDFAAFGQAIKAARTARKESRKDVSDAMNISPRFVYPYFCFRFYQSVHTSRVCPRFWKRKVSDMAA